MAGAGPAAQQHKAAERAVREAVQIHQEKVRCAAAAARRPL